MILKTFSCFLIKKNIFMETDEQQQQQQLYADPWRSFDPLEADWLCEKCGAEQGGLPAICGECLQPRILDQDQQEQLEESQRTGELLCKVVIMAEALPENIGSELDSADECLREWNDAKTQRLKVNGQTKYLLLAFPDAEDDDEADADVINEHLAEFCKVPNKVFNFSEKKSLNRITEEIIYTEFGAALQSQNEQQMNA